MNLNIVDDKTHRVNDELNYEVSRVEEQPVIIVDNVWRILMTSSVKWWKNCSMQYNDLESRGEPDEVFPEHQSRLFVEL